MAQCRREELLINLLMSDAIPITIRYSLKLDVKAIIQHKRDLDPFLPLKNAVLKRAPPDGATFFKSKNALITSLKMSWKNR